MSKSTYNKAKLVDQVFKYVAMAFTIFALVILLVLLIDIFSSGLERINWSFFTFDPGIFNQVIHPVKASK